MPENDSLALTAAFETRTQVADLSPGQADMGSSLADDVADEPRAADLSHSLAVSQDVEDAVKALIQFQLSELLDISLHNKK